MNNKLKDPRAIICLIKWLVIIFAFASFFSDPRVGICLMFCIIFFSAYISPPPLD